MKRVALFALALCLLATPVFAEMEWKLIKEKKGVRTYMREFPGTDVKEFKAITILNARLEVIAALLRDIPAFVEWFPQCKDSILLEEIDVFSFLFYNEFWLPWPLSNRDVVLDSRVDIDTDTGRAHARFQAVKDPLVPLRKNTVRLTDLKGTFSFEYLGRSFTRVMLAYRVDPGGKIPLSLANLAIRNLPYMTLKRIQEKVKEPEYAKRAENSVEQKMVEDLLADEDVTKKAMKNRLTEYFQYPDLVNTLMNDKDFCEIVFREDVCLDDIRGQVGRIIKTVLEGARVGDYIHDPEVAEEIQSSPRLVEKLLEDRLVVEMMLDGAGTFEEIVILRARHHM